MSKQVIGILVRAADEREARAKAKQTLEELTSSKNPEAPFDYYLAPEDEKEFPVFSLKSKEGKSHIERLWKRTEADFLRIWKSCMACVKGKNDEEIINDLEVRDLLRVLGETRGSSIWIYSQNGTGVLTKNDLSHALDESKKQIGNAIYVVLACVHS